MHLPKQGPEPMHAAKLNEDDPQRAAAKAFAKAAKSAEQKVKNTLNCQLQKFYFSFAIHCRSSGIDVANLLDPGRNLIDAHWRVSKSIH